MPDLNLHKKIKNRITFKTKSVYYFELLTRESTRLLIITWAKINKDDSRVLHIFMSNNLIKDFTNKLYFLNEI